MRYNKREHGYKNVSCNNDYRTGILIYKLDLVKCRCKFNGISWVDLYKSLYLAIEVPVTELEY